MLHTMKRIDLAFASAARTADPTAVTLDVPKEATAAYAVVDVTAIVTAPSIQLTLGFYDPISDTTVNLLTSSAIAATGTNLIRLSPQLTAAADIGADHLPGQLVVGVTHANANSITYSVSIHWLT